MITHIRMKNFKSWQDSGEVKLAPLTGFFGTNSSGKSSLLQMLSLLKQTAEHPDLNEVIFFGHDGSLVNLGSFREVIHGHKAEEKLELEFGCTIQNSFTIKVSGKAINIDSFIFETAIREVNRSPVVENFFYTVGTEANHKIIWQDGEIRYRNPQNLGDNYLGNLRIKNFYGSSDSGTIRALEVVQGFSFAFEKLFLHTYYLGPTRVDPRRRYNWSGDHPRHIRQWGNQTIDALLSARVRKLKTRHEEGEIPIEERVSYWLQEMELAHSFSLDWTSQGSKEYEVRIQKTSASPPVTLVDMGYGLSQFLPVLVLCYYTPVGSTLILEQPGIHLHPKVQSQLADLLIEVVTERKLQVLIESHSEHLLNRLQRRIAEEKISVDKTALYFCRNDEGVSEIDELDMDEFGNITNWPENFFGDEMGDLFAMTKAQRERQKRAES